MVTYTHNHTQIHPDINVCLDMNEWKSWITLLYLWDNQIQVCQLQRSQTACRWQWKYAFYGISIHWNNFNSLKIKPLSLSILIIWSQKHGYAWMKVTVIHFPNWLRHKLPYRNKMLFSYLFLFRTKWRKIASDSVQLLMVSFHLTVFNNFYWGVTC